MKPLIFIMAFLCATAAVGQKRQLAAAKQDFDKAYELWEQEKPYDALDAFKAFMKKYPFSPLSADAHFNVGFIQYALQDYKAAASTFQEILNMEYNELAANNLMEPYKLYKHNSARYLAEISLEVKEWDDAEQYIHMFDKEYPYQHFCGNEWAAYDIVKATMEARLHEGQGKIDKAVADLVPHISYNGLASNREAVDLLTSILRRNYSDQEIKTELERSLTTVKITTSKKEKLATVTLFGAEVKLDRYALGGNEVNEEEVVKALKGSEVYAKFAK